jgi:iron complex transport system substrate-binding protein
MTGRIRTVLAALAIGLCPVYPGLAQPPARIVSLVPAVTEMLFGIGAGELVVGVSSFDRHPPEVGALPRVGGLLDPDVERVMSLRPDLVVVYATQQELRGQLTRAGIEAFPYRHGSGLAAIAGTIRTLGALADRRDGAEALASRIEQRLAAVSARVGGRPRPRTLMVFDRQPSSLRGIYASGGVGFLHDMLETAGGLNVFADVDRESVQLNLETLISRAPEVIVELQITGDIGPEATSREAAAWSQLPTIPAVRDGRVYLLSGDAFVVPGPRIAESTERLARALHPEAFDDEP